MRNSWLLGFGFFLLAQVASAQTNTPAPPVEMHVIGLYEASNRSLGVHYSDIVDWPHLCAKLARQREQAQPGPAQRLWMSLSEDVQAIVHNAGLAKQFNDPQASEDAVEARGLVGRALQELLERPALFDETPLQGVELSDAIKALLSRRQSLSRLERRWLNRLLLQEAFPEEIKKISETEMPGIVTVHVLLTHQPLVLVLTAIESVRWHVIAVPESQIQQIIVAGAYNVQEVTGTEVPITERKHLFFTYKQNDKRYVDMADKLRQLTGLEITTFQGQYHYDGRPFVIGPKTP